MRDIRGLIERVAKKKDPLQSQAERHLPRGIRTKLRRAFTPRGLAFFDFYILLRKISLGGEVPGDLFQQYRRATSRLVQVTSPVDGKGISPLVVNQIAQTQSMFRLFLGRLVSGRVDDALTWKKINDLYVPLFIEVAKDKGIYLRALIKGRERWATFRRMNARQERLEHLRDEDPETFALMDRLNKTIEEIDTNIKESIAHNGELYRRSFIMGRPAHLGIDPVTGEERVYDRDGEVLSMPQYIDKRKGQEEAKKKLDKVSTRSRVNPKDLRTLSDEQLEALEGPMEWESLSDDKAKAGRLTRTFPVKDFPMWEAAEDGTMIKKAYRVVAAGRFKGAFLDDLVNSKGRLIEGTAYSFNEDTAHQHGIPVRIDPSQREPYVTTAEVKVGKTKEKKLFLKIPGDRAHKELRRAIKRLSGNIGTKRGSIPTVEYVNVPGSHAIGAYFDPKDFGVIRDTLQGMSLSKGAMEHLKSYFKELANAELATAKENLSYYSTKELGGFVTSKKNRSTGEMESFDLLVKQKQALAWMDANGNRGVCALGTGLGKCVAEGTLISTSKGLVPIEDINPGNSEPDSTHPVFNWNVVVDGNEIPVANFYYGGVKPTLKIKTRRGYEVEATLVHPLLVRTDTGEDWVKAANLKEGDVLCISRNHGSFSQEEPRVRVPERSDFSPMASHLRIYPVADRMSPELGRLLGYIVAEGWVNHDSLFSISQCPEKNPETRRDIDTLLKACFGITPDSGKDCLIASSFLCKYMRGMGIDKVLSKDKSIPSIVLRSTKETVTQFVRSLVDAESYVVAKTPHIEFSTASETLGKQLQTVLLNFGVLCSRRPKKVKGYDHTYWRLTITGKDAVRYRDLVGFISLRKQEAAQKWDSQDRNDNLDVVPHTKELVRHLWQSMSQELPGSSTAFREKLGSLESSARHIKDGRRNPTYPFLKQFLHEAVEMGLQEHSSLQELGRIFSTHYFYDSVESVESSSAKVMDIEVDSPEHCFVANGIMSHNTLSSISIMQKLIRDGATEEEATFTDPKGRDIKTNGRFLFVCPGALRGNLPKEIKTWISDPSSLRDKVDVISYREFSGGVKSGNVPRSIKRVPYWAEKASRSNGKKAKKGPTWDIQEYVAIFFDEAHELKNYNGARTKAIMSVWHPRKILLTASPMEKSPMESYVLAAIANNKPLHGMSPEARKNRKEMRRFKERFCETVGGRIVGVKDDPMVQRDLHVWVKRNIFYGDKTDVEEFSLPQLTAQTAAVEMPQEMEEVYRTITDQFSNIMRGLVAKYRDKGRKIWVEKDPETGEEKVRNQAHPDAKDPAIERAFSMAFFPVIKLLNDLSNMPDRAFRKIAHMIEHDEQPNGKPISKSLRPVIETFKDKFSPSDLRKKATEMGNPKLEHSAEVVFDKLANSQGGAKTILFSDDKEFCMATGEYLAATVPGKHAVALSQSIHIFGSGGEIKEYRIEIDQPSLERVRTRKKRQQILSETGGVSVHKLPFRKRRYKRHPALPASRTNPNYRTNDWQTFALQEVISKDPEIKTAVLHGQTYQTGQNLQAFTTVIHLDRDTWNAEDMQQRTARAWRQGQDHPVDEITVDMIYPESKDGAPRDDMDHTLDEIRKHLQVLEGELFDRIIKDAQSTELGAEWLEMKKRDASTLRVDEKLLEAFMSPYASRSKPPGM